MFYYTTGNPEVAHLFRQAQAGDRLSLDQLMRQHDGLVHHIIRRQWHGPLTYAEVLQEGRIGLWHAILAFDVERGFAFSTYASVAIARQVWRTVALRQDLGEPLSRAHPVQRPVLGAERLSRAVQDEAVPERESPPVGPQPAPALDPLTGLLEQEIKVALHRLVVQLPAKRRWIVCSYYGLDGQGAHTLAQLGQQLGCTRQGVHYHLGRALLHLRHPAFSAALRALVGRNRRQDYLQALQPGRRRS